MTVKMVVTGTSYTMACGGGGGASYSGARGAGGGGRYGVMTVGAGGIGGAAQSIGAHDPMDTIEWKIGEFLAKERK